MTTGFIDRLRTNDQAAWFELWETFGPVVRAQLAKWGRGRIGSQTVQDLSQETLAALSESIDRFDPTRGARFSTWLLAIAKHVLGDELDRRGAKKRGGSKRPAELDESWMAASAAQGVDEQYEAAIFRAKVEAAIRLVAQECDFTDYSIYSMRVLEGRSGKDVAAALGISEPTVSRRMARVRDALRIKLAEVVRVYSFTPDELDEVQRKGLGPLPNHASVPNQAQGQASRPSTPSASTPPVGPAADAAFDDAVGDIYRLQLDLRRRDQAQRLA
jgi:RNA polymerase sigma factor (sigma-70 family)